MKTPDYPCGPVLTIGMVSEKDRQEIVRGLQDAHQITLCIDNECYDVRTVAKYQCHVTGQPYTNSKRIRRRWYFIRSISI